jgi:hypothetical protein
VKVISFHIGKGDFTMPTSTEAAEALAAMQASQARLAAAANCPPERHLIFGALIGALVLTPALPVTLMFVVEAVVLVGIALVVRWDRRRTGMFINGYRRGKTRWVTFSMLAAFLALYVGSTLLAFDWHLPWGSVACGVITVAIGYFASIRWQRVFRREMGLDA